MTTSDPLRREIRTPRFLFFGRDLACGSVGDVMLEILARAESQCGGAVGYLNAHTTNLLFDSGRYRKATADFDLIYPDGMGVVRAARRLGAPVEIERVNAGDFLVRFCWMAHARGLRVALIGSAPGVADRAARRLARSVAGFQPAMIADGHFEIGGREEAQLLARLEAAKPHVILVGMGSPRQEQWVADHRDRLPESVWWCVGALFEYYADRPRAPWWMRQAGLEWLFRLALEPRRLGARYLLGNLRFLNRVRAESAKSSL